MKKKIRPSIIVFGTGISADDVGYYTEKGIKDLGVFLGTKVLHMKKKQAIKQNALLKNLRFFEKNIIHHKFRSGVHKGFEFQESFKTKPVLDVKYSILKKRIKRLQGG